MRAALASGVRGFLVSCRRTVRAPARRGPAPRPRRPAPGRPAPTGSPRREVEVLQLVADGRSNKDIGEVLGLSALTVKSHLARIARKLGTGDRAEMVVVCDARRRRRLTAPV